MSDKVIQQAALPDFNPFPGYCGKLIHAETMTVVHWTIESGFEVPDHAHPHEQIVNMMEGEFELTVAGEAMHLRPGDIVVIPGDVRHAGRSITDCKIIDIWHPRREDYQVETK